MTWELLPIPGYLISCAWKWSGPLGGRGGRAGDGVGETHQVRFVLLFSSVGSRCPLPTALSSEAPKTQLIIFLQTCLPLVLQIMENGATKMDTQALA